MLDVSLACEEGKVVQAHKVILSACSSFFRSVLEKHPHQHPLLYLRGVKYDDLVAILDFMYQGEVNVKQEEVNSFLAVAEDLNVKGLTHSKRSEQPSGDDAPSSVEREAIKRPFTSEHSQPSPGERPTKKSKANVSNSQNSHLDNRLPQPAPPDEVQEDVLPPKLAVKTETQDTMIEDPIHVKEEYEGTENSYYNYQQGYENDMINYENYYDEHYITENNFQQLTDSGENIIDNRGGKRQYIKRTEKCEKNSEGQYVCQHCEYKTKDAGNFWTHVDSIHEGVRYPCSECDFVAKRKGHLKIHVNTVHLGVRYPCNKCEYRAKSRGDLRTHRLGVHEGVRHPCDQCDYKATTRGALNRHRESIHEGVRYPCSECEYSATEKGSLKRHVRRHHTTNAEQLNVGELYSWEQAL